MTLIAFITAQAAVLKKAEVSFGHGTTNAFDEAAWLVMWALGLPLDALEEQAQRALSVEESAKAVALIEKRIATRQPAAYLTGEAWLQNVAFYADARSIIPRSFIAELLADGEGEGTLDTWLSEDTQQVLDLCTGNGSLAVIAAMAYPDVVIDASDISQDALDVARINVDKHQLGSRVRLVASDLFGQITGRYDLILCNPPYVNAHSMALLPPEYQCEPSTALHGGEDGMDLVRRIVLEAAEHLSPHGVLVLEIGNERAHFEHAFRKLEVVWLPTSAGANQVLLVSRDSLVRWVK
jgi:ribosomal protein L3 glutamine methyltransferase